MKVTHIIYDSVGNPWLNGGGAKRTQELYSRRPTDIGVTILAGNFKGAVDEIDGVRYRRLGMQSTYVLSRLSFLLLIWVYCLSMQADLVVEDIGFPFPLVLTTWRNKCVGSLQFIPNQSFYSKRRFAGKFVRLFFTRGLKYYRNFVTVSEFAATFIRSNSPATVRVIPNGVESNAKSIAPSGDNYFLFLGRIDINGKGLDTLVDAFKIASRNQPMELIIAGSGEEKEVRALQIRISRADLKKRIKVVGHVEGAIKDKLISQCFAIVVPSRNETASISSLEAFSYAKPVIGTSVGGLTELILNSKAGILVDPDDPIELGKQMLALYQDKAKAKRLSKNALSFAKKNTWDQSSTEYFEFLRDVANA